jgi:hypothetical protein
MLAASKALQGRQNCSLSLDREVIHELQGTKGSLSTSERANQLLRAALEAEKLARLEKEAREFYLSASGSAKDREEVRAFRAGTVKSWNRE